jgi:malonyl-CoA O-methyltransferase
MINKDLLQKRFSKAAKSYDQYANVQKKMANRLLQDIVNMHDCDQQMHILELGCGTGYLTERLAFHFPNAEITAVDFAPGMLEVANARVPTNRVTFLCCDIEQLAFEQKYDVIVSNATFQWLNDFQGAYDRFYDALKETGTLHFSTFGEHTFYELHASFQRAKEEKGVQDGSSIGQSFFTLDELKHICFQNKEDWQEAAECLYTEAFSDVREFFQSIRKIGATNSNEGSYCQSPELMRTMMRVYNRDFRIEEHIIATYHALFILIEKKGEKKNGTTSNKAQLEAVSAKCY